MPARQIADFPVGSIGLGGAPWSFSDPVDPELSIRTAHAAIEAGVRLIDTALAYTTLDEESHNEDLVRRALDGHPLRDEVLVATKGGHYRAGTGDFPIDGRPETLRRHVETSLRHLDVEQLGLYQLHRPDPDRPIEESVQTLAELRQAGKLRLIGLSNVDVDQLDRAIAITPIASVQNQFSPYAAEDRPMIADCDRRGVAYLAYSPLGGSGRAAKLAEQSPVAAQLAARLDVSIQQVVLAWILSTSPTIIPIVGARRPATIVDSAAAADLVLDPADIAALDAGEPVG
jgi:aryl-alcohol dehydrogenase-like predicted oxidoreductase